MEYPIELLNAEPKKRKPFTVRDAQRILIQDALTRPQRFEEREPEPLHYASGRGAFNRTAKRIMLTVVMVVVIMLLMVG